MTNILPDRWQGKNFWRLAIPLIAVAIVGLSAYLGRYANPMNAFYVTAGVGAIIAFVVFTHQPMWGLVGLILTAFFARQEIGTGTNVPFNLTLLLVILIVTIWIFHMVGGDREIKLVFSQVNRPALGFIGATTLSLAAGNVQWILLAPPGASFLAQLGAWLLYVLPVALLLYAQNQVNEEVWLKRFVWVFLAGGSVYLISRIVPGMMTVLKYILVPDKGFGSVFWIWFAALSLSMMLFNRDLSLRARALMGILFASVVYSAWFQSRSWVSGWGMILIVIIILIWLYSWKLGLGLTLLGGLIFLLFKANLISQVMDPTQIYSVESREATYPIMIELIKANPILGLGPANYYHFTPLYSILGWRVKFNSHNNYMDIVAQTGLVGLGMFLWLAIELIRTTWGLRNWQPSGFVRAYVFAALAGFVAMLVSGWLGDWFLPFIYNISTAGFRSSVLGWLFMGGILVLHQARIRQQASQPVLEGAQE